MDPLNESLLERIRASHCVVPIGKTRWQDRLVIKLLASCALTVMLWVNPIPAAAVENVSKVSATMQRKVGISPEEATSYAPFVELGALDSRLGEGKHDFLLRAARILDAFTARTGQEACGAIMHSPSDNTWRVRLITNRSQIACMRIVFQENGFLPTQETIHSHPLGDWMSSGKRVSLNAMDVKLRNVGVCGKSIAVFDRDFSDGDVKNGSGYLVARGKLLYLPDPNEKSQVIGIIDRVSPLDRLTLSTPEQKKTTKIQGEVLSASTDAPESPAVAVWSKQASGEGLPDLSCHARSGK